MPSISIGVVDDHPLFREGVTRSLSEIRDFVVVGEGSNSADAMSIARGNRPDVLLLDLSMPGDGLSVIGQILATSPATKIIILTASEDVEILVDALQRGARGYVLKGVGSRGLAEAIRSVFNGSRFVAPTMTAKIVETTVGGEERKKEALTAREREVMDLVAQGMSNKQIGLRLDLQEKTVKHHMTQILTKLAVSNRTEAALRWRDRH